MIEHRGDIDGLRAVAILGVVIYHASPQSLPGGFTGVDVFFVISGYLITGLIWPDIAARRFSLSDFMARRARRLFPALAVMCGVIGIAAAAILLPQDLPGFAKSLLAAITFTSNIHYYGATGYFAAPAAQMPLLHLWTLAVEAQFYLLAPIGLLLLRRFRQALVLALVILACLASFGLSLWATAAMPEAAFFLLPARAWELGLGAALALAPRLRLASLLQELLSCAGLGLILLGFAGISHLTAFPGWAALVPTLGAVAFILAGPNAISNQALSLRPVQALGRISYGLYLWHWPMLVLAAYVAIDPLSPVARAGIIAVSILLAWASWHGLETRVRHWRLILHGIGTAGAAIGIFAAIILSSGRSPFGTPDQLAHLEDVTLARPLNDALCSKHNLKGTTVCVLGDPKNAPQFLLWGDSHALAIASAFDKAAHDRGISGLVMTRIACPPLPGLRRADRPDGEQCREFNARVLSTVPESVSAVILAARWPVYFHGESDPQNNHRSPRFDGIAVSQQPAAVSDVLLATLRALSDKEVTILGVLPEPGTDLPSLLGRSIRFGITPDPPGPDSTERAISYATDRTLAALAKAGDAGHVKLGDMICDQVSCRFHANGIPYFKDSNHLSEAGARLLLPRIAPLLDDHDARSAQFGD